MHLLWLVLFVAVTSWLSWIGPQRWSRYIWDLFKRCWPDPIVAAAAAKRAQLADLKSQRAATNSKDEFAKWAKIDREHRKTKQELDQLDAQMGSKNAKLQRVVKYVHWTLTSGIMWFVQFKYRSVPIFTLPPQVLPRWVEYLLSMPSAPMGTVSVVSFIAIIGVSFSSLVKSLKTAHQSLFK